VKIENEKLVQILLNGFLESYKSFVQGLSTLGAFPTFKQIVGNYYMKKKEECSKPQHELMKLSC